MYQAEGRVHLSNIIILHEYMLAKRVNGFFDKEKINFNEGDTAYYRFISSYSFATYLSKMGPSLNPALNLFAP